MDAKILSFPANRTFIPVSFKGGLAEFAPFFMVWCGSSAPPQMALLSKMALPLVLAAALTGACNFLLRPRDHKYTPAHYTGTILLTASAPPVRVVTVHRAMNEMRCRLGRVEHYPTLRACFHSAVFGAVGRDTRKPFVPRAISRIRQIASAGTESSFSRSVKLLPTLFTDVANWFHVVIIPWMCQGGKYFDIACERVDREVAQGRLFEPRPKPEQMRIPGE